VLGNGVCFLTIKCAVSTVTCPDSFSPIRRKNNFIYVKYKKDEKYWSIVNDLVCRMANDVLVKFISEDAKIYTVIDNVYRLILISCNILDLVVS